MKIEIGKKYVDHVNNVVHIVCSYTNSNSEFFLGIVYPAGNESNQYSLRYLSDGTCYDSNSNRNLSKEYREPVKVTMWAVINKRDNSVVLVDNVELTNFCADYEIVRVKVEEIR